MGLLEGTPPVCSLDPHCSQWARTYLKYCLCGVKDGVALTLGMVSIVSWGVAEIPQIITNYKQKSAEGLSIAFLMTWIVGDLFNLIGCLLEPATLPTQFYMALLFTATTVVLAAQTVYYGHIYARLKANKISVPRKSDRIRHEEASRKDHVDKKESETEDYFEHVSSVTMASSPIPVAAPLSRRYSSGGKELYYMSARSLTKSPIPPVGSWLAHSRDSGRTPPIGTHNQHPSREPLLAGLAPIQSAPPLNTKNTLCVVSSAIFFCGIYGINLSMDNNTFHASPPGMVIQLGRRILQDKAAGSLVQEGSGSSEIGSILGWAMAAIYMGGRLPQICLNIKRGNVEGLNPLMFVFALIGNATYVGSILVNSLEWSKIRPNMPWLVDAGGCVLLDSFILIQFVYFHYRKPKESKSRDDH